MSTPLVSVGVASYNKARFIESTLDSIKAQSLRDFELTIVDDCSTDGSVNIIETWISKEHVPCRLLTHSSNQGVCKTVNEILAISRGKYMACLGADDLWFPHTLERLTAVIEQLPEHVAVVYGDAELMDEGGRLLPGRFIDSYRHFASPPEGRIFYTLLEGNFIPGMSTIVRLDCLRAVGGIDESLWYEDWDLWLRLAHEYSFVHVPGALAQYRVVRDSMVRSDAMNPLLDESSRQIVLKWVGYDEQTDRVLERRYDWLPESLYGANHPAARQLLIRRLKRRRRSRELVMLVCISLNAPFSWFQRIDRTWRRVQATFGRGMRGSLDSRRRTR